MYTSRACGLRRQRGRGLDEQDALADANHLAKYIKLLCAEQRSGLLLKARKGQHPTQEQAQLLPEELDEKTRVESELLSGYPQALSVSTLEGIGQGPARREKAPMLGHACSLEARVEVVKQRLNRTQQYRRLMSDREGHDFVDGDDDVRALHSHQPHSRRRCGDACITMNNPRELTRKSTRRPTALL